MNSQTILMRAESRSMKNDPILVITLLVPVLIILMFRYGYPLFEVWLQGRSGFDLSPYRVLMLSILVLITPMMIGMLSGFMLLDDKEDKILDYLSVTPLTPTLYLRWRIMVPLVLSVFLTPLVILLTNLAPVPFPIVIGATLMASLEAPFLSIMLAQVCQNKVEGLAVAKATGIFFCAPIAAWLLPQPWSLLMYVVPFTWASRLFWGGNAGLLAGIFIGGTVIHLVFLQIVLKRFR